MTADRRSRGRIFLIYSADWANARCAPSPTEVFHRSWSQLEMFPTPSPETVVFVQPDEGDLFETIRAAGAKHVVDIRDVPYLTLSGFDREKFFSVLRALVVDYVGVHALVHKTGSNSVSDLLTHALDAENGTRDPLETTLVQRLATGPTVVMCDDSPGADEKVGALLEYLSRKQVKHRPVLEIH